MDRSYRLCCWGARSDKPNFESAGRPFKSRSTPQTRNVRDDSRQGGHGRPSLEEICAVRRDLIARAQAAQNLYVSIDRLPNRYGALFRPSSVLNEDNRGIAFADNCCCGNDKRLMRCCLRVLFYLSKHQRAVSHGALDEPQMKQ
jgi:hypothetical protein